MSIMIDNDIEDLSPKKIDNYFSIISHKNLKSL